MPVAGWNTQDAAVSCVDLLRWDEAQLVRYLKRQDSGSEFDISSLLGVGSLSRTQKDDLTEKLSKAALLLPFGTDDLHARLQNVASTRCDTSSDVDSSGSWADSTASTPPPVAVHHLEVSSREELVRDGGRPVCSMEELNHLLAAPMERHEAVLSWSEDSVDTEARAEQLKTIFSRQFMRWWDFRRSQWDNRGLGDSMKGLSAFLEASRRRYERSGAKTMVSSPSFDETIRRQWRYLPESRRERPPPEGQTFASYCHAVNLRLATHRFSPSLQLRKDPQKQTGWTDWLEYLSFELRCLEDLTAAANSLESSYHECIGRLQEGRQHGKNNAVSGSAPPDSVRSRKHCLSGQSVNVARDLAAACADRDASWKLIDTFLRGTTAYTQARRNALQQRYRVEWVIREAHLMHADISLQRKFAKSRKRKQHDEAPYEPQAKRRRQGDVDGESAKTITQPDLASASTSTRRSMRHRACRKS